MWNSLRGLDRLESKGIKRKSDLKSLSHFTSNREKAFRNDFPRRGGRRRRKSLYREAAIGGGRRFFANKQTQAATSVV